MTPEHTALRSAATRRPEPIRRNDSPWPLLPRYRARDHFCSTGRDQAGATGLGDDSTLLLGLDGVSVVQVERLEDGHPADRHEAERAVTRARDLPHGVCGLEFR